MTEFQLQRLIRFIWDIAWTPESLKYSPRWFWCVGKFEHKGQGQRIRLNKYRHQGGLSPSFLKKFPEKSSRKQPDCTPLLSPSVPLLSIGKKITSTSRKHITSSKTMTVSLALAASYHFLPSASLPRFSQPPFNNASLKSLKVHLKRSTSEALILCYMTSPDQDDHKNF